MSLCPIVTGSGLTEDEVVGAEELTERTGTDRVHCARLEIDEDGTGDVFASGGLVVVDVDTLQLEVRVSMVGTSGVDSMLIGNDFPELGTNLVTTLTGLKMNDFSHF